MANPLLSDRDVEFLLYEVLHAERLCALPWFADHSRETFDLFLASCRKLAREQLFPAYKPMDEFGSRLENKDGVGRVKVHPAMRELWPRMAEMGLVNATRPAEVGGQQLPGTVAGLGTAYLMAANLAAYAYCGLTTGAGHLLEAFGDERLRRLYMDKLYAGEWAGTMALTEPQAGSSLSDVKTRARPTGAEDGHYLLDGNKVFISGGDQDVTGNIVHLALARIEGAPAGIRGVSLFCVPRLRPDDSGALVDNDCASAGTFHKLGWRGLPSIALNFGERGDCRGWLVGEPNKGISYMFQMMNEARIMVGMNAAATASAAYQEALEYAKQRPQGRPLSSRDPASPQVPIVQHADVRRMLLRQKAIVEGSLALVAETALQADLAHHGADGEERHRAHLLLDLLTPLAKTFPAEKGFESCALSVQVHGGYGYTAEYLPEAWLRDQKLNTLHEGTTGIQSMDLLGRKVVAEGGAALQALLADFSKASSAAREAGDRFAPLAAHAGQLEEAGQTLAGLTMALASLGLAGDRDGMLRHSVDYLELTAVTVVAWLWLRMATAASAGLARGGGNGPHADFHQGKLRAAAYWFAAEVPRVAQLAALCASGEESYETLRPEWL
jgi:butyryl-CoA dehydrogenase